MLSCKCSEIMLKHMGNEFKLRTKVVVFRDDKSYGICKGCGSEVEIPITLNKSFGSPTKPASTPPKIFVKK